MPKRAQMPVHGERRDNRADDGTRQTGKRSMPQIIEHKKTGARIVVRWGNSPTLERTKVPGLFPSRKHAVKDLQTWLTWHREYKRRDFTIKHVRVI